MPRFEKDLDIGIPAQEHPDLDHRVRQRDEAGRAEGRHRGPAGRLHPAGDRHGEGGQARADVRLVRDAGLARAASGRAGSTASTGAAKPGAADLRPRRPRPEPRERQGDGQGRHPQPARHRRTSASTARTTRSARASATRRARTSAAGSWQVDQGAGELGIDCTVPVRVVGLDGREEETYRVTVTANTAHDGRDSAHDHDRRRVAFPSVWGGPAPVPHAQRPRA